MTKEAWCQHIESISGLVRPSRGGDFRQWRNFIASHNKTGCVECKQRAKTAKANATRKNRDSAMELCGLTKVRGAVSGRVYWE